MIYRVLKRVIESGSMTKENLAEKLDVYLLYGRIEKAEYEELMMLLEKGTK